MGYQSPNPYTLVLVPPLMLPTGLVRGLQQGLLNYGAASLTRLTVSDLSLTDISNNR